MLSTRLAELNIELAEVPQPVAAYIPAKRSGNWVFTSGQLPLSNGVLLEEGGQGAFSSEEQIPKGQKAARQCFLNALAAAAAVVGVDNVLGVVKLTVFVNSDPRFTGHPLVGNGASELAQEIFGEAGQHSRSAVGVAALPRGASVEVEVIFEVK